MVAKHRGNGEWNWDPGDTKPTGVAINSIGRENGTDDTYRFNGTSWVLYVANDKTETLTNKTISNDSNTFPYVGAYNAVIYKSGTTYKAKKDDGTQLASSTTLDAVVQAALDIKGLIYWIGSSDGTAYTPGGSFAGWNLSEDTTLVIAQNNNITMPQGQTGYTFILDDTVGGDHKLARVSVSGGRFVEGGASPSALWTLFKIKSGSSTAGNAGVYGNSFRNIYVKRCKTMFDLDATTGTSSWINGNLFDSCWCDYPKQGIVFQQGNPVGASVKAINKNTFNNLVIQADPAYTTEPLAMTHGIKDISGVNNGFFSCKVWDVNIPNTTCNITNKAENTVIFGGTMLQEPYDWEVSQNFGARTAIIGTERTGGSSVGLNTSLGNPFIRKMGMCHAVGTGTTNTTILIGDGNLAGMQGHGTGGSITYTAPTSTADGLCRRASTGTTSATLTGFRSSSTTSSRNFNPIFQIRYKLGQITNQRIFIGFADTTTTTHATNDDPLVSLTGFGLYHSTTHGTSATNWLTCTNTGSATSTFANTSLAANNTNAHTVYIAGWQDGPKFQWRLDDTAGQIGDVTSTIPGQFTNLLPGIWISNGAAAETKTLDFFGAYLKHAVAEV